MSNKKSSQPQTSPTQPGGGVDFLVRTMIEREATGKRPIRPKNVEDLLQSTMQDESDDPDFDCGDEDSDSAGTVETDDGSNDSDNEGDGTTQDSDESDDEDYQGKEENEDGSSSDDHDDSGSNDESSNDESHGSDSDAPDVSKKSALRETLEKLNEVNDFIGKRPAKKKRKAPKNRENSKPKKVVAKKLSKKKLLESAKLKSSSAQKTAKSTGKKSGGSKTKRVVLAKKSKVSSRKTVSEKKKKKKERKLDDKTKNRSILSLIDSAVINQKENRKEIEVTKPICSACLGDKSDDSNEIVECDSCGISVHEICYGLSADNLSISSGSGSSSCTEPWFCDVCKSGSENMYCELCPIEGGLFKESTAGRWVHLVCAMYTQGVALHHDSSINLYEIQYARWGSHNCAACENERQAHTGIVISCDAGLCKTYFHATCAQKLGLLSDPNQVDFAEADPYYVSCKLHTNRETMKRRIKLFNTLQEQLRIKKERKELEGLPSGANTDHARILRKLDKVRQKTALKRAQYLNSLDNITLQITAGEVGVNPLCNNMPSSWTSGNKKQRLMHTSAKLGSDFLRKTERLGEDIVANELEVKHEKIVANVKRKWNVLPGMSVEYAAYYSDRENRITGLVDQYEKSFEENHVLMDKEIGLKDVYETHVVNQMAMTEETESVSKQLESLATILTSVCPNDKKLATKLQFIVRPKELTGTRRKSPSTSKGDRKSLASRRSSVAKKLLKNRVLSPSPSRAGKLAVAVCDTCSKSDSQHLITRCDKCRKHYHLSCLDPPLTRMPKRSRLCGWMCSDCCEAPSEAEGHVDTEAPRTLRGRTKIHKPRKYRGSDDSEDEKPSLETDTSKTGSKKSPKSNASSFNSPEAKSSGDAIVSVTTPTSARMHSSTPMERRRRSGSANLQTTVTPITTICSPITPLLTNGPSFIPDIPSMKTSGKTATQMDVNSSAELKAIMSPTMQAKPSKKKKTGTTPKAARLKQKKRNSQEHSAINNDSTYKSAGVSPLKRKSSDGPLTSFKVNGIHDNPLQHSEDDKLVTMPKPKSRNKKKKHESVVMPVSIEFKTEVSSIDTNSTEQGGKNVKQKKPRKKKEVVVKTEGIDDGSNIDIKKEDIPKVEKVKKPRKKKEKVEKESTTSINFATTPEETPSSEIDKKGKKKSTTKPRISVNPVAPTVNVSREEANGVNLAIGKVTSQIIFKNLQNGTVRITKKRKSNQSTAETTPQQTAELSFPSPDEKEKEKSVPPKKRKRVSSSANQGQPNSVDSIIEAVSSGDFSDKTLENGGCDVKPSDMSTIMQRVSPINRQMAPEHKLMQGKAMGSGFNSGEMVTVNASFLIDGATSSQSSFSVSNSTVSTFYASSSQQDSTGDSQNEAAVLKLTSSGGNCVSGNSENVIRLQYIDAPSGTIPDSATMPPAPLSSSSNVFPQGTNDVCFTCTKTDNKIHLVTCDKCLQAYHFMCLNPPLKYSPRRKGHPWFCHNCDDGETQHQENGVLPPVN